MDDSYNPLISVIVPIYNVEKHVRKCLDSLKNQTLKQIEIIMVDDGSTDKSGTIAKEYVTAPGLCPEFRFIRHENNLGLSAARNTGIYVAKADYLMFVDSDDWVSKDFCRIPYETAIQEKADMVIFLALNASEKGREKKPPKKINIPIGVVDTFTAIEFGWDAAWNRLYKRELFDDVQYPIGRVCEDIATTYKLVLKAERIILLPTFLYYYIKRSGSISNTRSKQRRHDCFLSTLERYKNLISYGYPEEKLTDSLYSAAIGYLISARESNNTMYLNAVSIIEGIKGIPQNLTWKQKRALCLWRLNKRLFHFICMVLESRQTTIE